MASPVPSYPSPAALARELEARLGAPTGGRRIGVEHEYAVFEGDVQLDFRTHVDAHGLPGTALHPTNRYQVLHDSGIALMADGLVAESASPPERVQPGFATALSAWADRGRALLTAASPAGARLFRGSTHISVETSRQNADQLCLWYAQTFASALMLCTDNVLSPGALVRPRPGRIEWCGEYVEGARLRVASILAAGAVVALEQARNLPPAVEVVVEPARARFGWYIDRTAFGPDLYAEGRSAVLHLRAGGTTTAQDQLEACWAIARDALGDLLTPDDIEEVERLVRGDDPLPCEDADAIGFARTPAPVLTSAFGALAHQRGAIAVTPIAATWDVVAFRLADAQRSVVVTIPEARLAAFTSAVASGALDHWLESALDSAPREALEVHAQTSSVGVFVSAVVGDALLPRDRVGVGTGLVSATRPGKIEQPPPITDPPPPHTDPPRTDPEEPGRNRLFWIGGLVAFVSLVGVGIIGFLGGGGTETSPLTPTPTAVASVGPSATATTGVAVVPPVVGPVRAVLQAPVTTYTVQATSSSGRPLTYSWSLVADPGQDCGRKTPASAAPQASASATWSHDNAPPDACHHAAPDHPFTVTVEVNDGINPPVRRTYRGSETGTGPAN